MRIGLQYSGHTTFLSMIRRRTEIELEAVYHLRQMYLCLLGEFEKLSEGYEKIARVKEFIRSSDGTNPEIKIKRNEEEGFVDPIRLLLEYEAPKKSLLIHTRLRNLKNGDFFKSHGDDPSEYVVLEMQEVGENVVCGVLGSVDPITGKPFRHFPKDTMIVITVTG